MSYLKLLSSKNLKDLLSLLDKYYRRKDTLSSIPVNAVAATATLTSDNIEVVDGDTVTIGSITYRFKNTPAQAYDVKRHGTTYTTTLGYLKAAVNASGTPGNEYFAETLVHPDVTAGDVANSAIIFTAKTKGIIGNLIAKAGTSIHLDWDGVGAFFTGGVDGTVGRKYEVYLDGSSATDAYICIENNTTADTNWRKISLDSL